MPLAARALAAAVIALAWLAPGRAAASNPQLVAEVGQNDAFVISLTQPDGTPVTQLAPGTYDIVVHDDSRYHDFHLTGPGVDQSTTVAFVGTVTWTVTLQAGGSYHYQCDPHASIMHGDFDVTAASAPPPVPVSVALAGDGVGSVTSSPAGIACPGACSASFPAGATVALTAVAAPGSTFAGWDGACSGTGACTVTASAAQAVTATFSSSPPAAAQTYQLAVGLTGAGSVTSSPAGIACAPACAGRFAGGAAVTLAAVPAPGWVFAGWGGACAGAGACSVTMNADKTVTASFAAQAAAAVPLSLTLAGSGQGSVTSSPAGLECAATCSASWPAGTPVTLSAHPAPGSRFAGFSGACAGSGPCTLTLDAARQVTATFALASAGGAPSTTTRPLVVTSLRVRLLGKRPWRRVLVRLHVDRTAQLRGRVLRGRRPIASAWRWAPAGTRSLVVRIPRGARAGRYTVEIAVRDSAHHARSFRRTLVLGR